MPSSFTPSHRGGTGSPLVLLHGFTDTWRSWELVLPELEKHHDVFAPTLPGHAGGKDLPDPVGLDSMIDELEAEMDAAGFETAHIVGNSLGGFAALHLAARGRARSVVALAPAGGWADGDESFRETLNHFLTLDQLLKTAVQHVDAIVASPEGRAQATSLITMHPDHLTPDFVAHLVTGAATCRAVEPLVNFALREGWPLDASKVTCPVRMVWGHEDRLLQWPSAAAKYREQSFPDADWVELEGVGHCIQLDVPTEAAQLILGWTTD